MTIKLRLSPFSNNHVSRTFFRSVLMTAAVLLLVLGGVKLLAPFSSSAKQNKQGTSGQQKIAQDNQGRASCPTCSPQQRMIYAPLFDLPESSRSEIALNCRSAHDMVLTPTFYTLEGERYTGDNIILKPNEIRFVDTKSLIPENERNRHKWGGMAFSYVGGFMEAWAQLTLHGIRGGGSINVLFTVLSQKRSNTAEAVWWTPRGGSAVIALGNSSDEPVRANLTFASGESQSVDVRPFATEIVRLNSDVHSSAATDRVEAVSINYVGPEGSLIPSGYTSSANGKFASMIRFYDARQIVQQHLYANNLRIKNTKLHMALRNVSTDFITATPTFLPPSGDAEQSVKLSPIKLAPSEVVEVDLYPLLKAASNRSDLDSVSVQVSNTGNAGSLIGALYGFDTRIGVTYDVPLRDSGPSRASTGGYSVRIDKDYTTVVAISNTTDQPGEFTMQINHDGRPYVTGIIYIAPGETKTYDIRKLRDEQKPDINGYSLPRDLGIAQVRWSVRGKARLNGRAEVVSLKDRVSSSYSCFLCCGYSYAGGFITPFGATVLPGATVGFTAWERATISGGQSCGSDPEPYPVGGSWWSDNGSVATVSGGTATAISPGFAEIYCSWPAFRNEWDEADQSCEQTEETAETSTNMTVFRLRVTVPDAPIAFDASDTSASIIAGQPVTMRVEAVDGAGNVINNVNLGVSTSSSRTLDSSESGLPSSFTISNGSSVHGITLNRVNGTERGTTFRLAVSGSTLDYILYTYFQVTASREGLVGGLTACQHTITQNDHFVALPSTGLCNVGVVVRKDGAVENTTIRDVGPWYPHGSATPGNPCVGPNDPYWNTGGVPRVLSQSCDPNNAAIDLADGTAATFGISGVGTVLWRFQ